MANIYIIGNGFDLAHKINTSYYSFKQYLLQTYTISDHFRTTAPYVHKSGNSCDKYEAVQMLIKMISNIAGSNWSTLEEALGNLDYSVFFNNKNTPEYNDTILKGLSLGIPLIDKLFKEWIKTIKIDNTHPIPAFKKRIDIQKDYFFTFNYTHLLETVYGAKNVCHIHGDHKSPMLFGHGSDSTIEVIPNIMFEDFKGHNKLFSQHKKDNSSISIGYINLSVIDKYLHSLKNTNNYYIKKLNLYLNNLKRTLDIKINYEYRQIKKTTPKYSKKYPQNIKIKIPTYENYEKNIPYQDKFLHDKLKHHNLEEVINKIHSSLRKDTVSAVINIINFLSSHDISHTIDNIYVIGFSFSDVDMQVIQIISALFTSDWILDNYSKKQMNSYKKKLNNIGIQNNNISFFDFTQD